MTLTDIIIIIERVALGPLRLLSKYRTIGSSWSAPAAVVSRSGPTVICFSQVLGGRPRERFQSGIVDNQTVNGKIFGMELWQIWSKFKRLNLDFVLRRDRRSCLQAVTTMIENRKWQYGRQNRKYIYLSHEIWQHRNSKGMQILGFWPRRSRKSTSQQFHKWPTSGIRTAAALALILQSALR